MSNLIAHFNCDYLVAQTKDRITCFPFLNNIVLQHFGAPASLICQHLRALGTGSAGAGRRFGHACECLLRETRHGGRQPSLKHERAVVVRYLPEKLKRTGADEARPLGGEPRFSPLGCAGEYGARRPMLFLTFILTFGYFLA